MIDTFGQIVLGFFAELKVLHGNLAHKLEVFLKLVTRRQVIIVEFHPSDVRIGRGTDPERGHAATIDVQGAVGEEIEKQTVIGLLWVRDVLGEVVLVAHGVEGGRVVD